MKYKVGDKVKVIANSCHHQFKIGSIVTIIQLYTDHYKAENSDLDTWWIGDDDLSDSE